MVECKLPKLDAGVRIPRPLFLLSDWIEEEAIEDESPAIEPRTSPLFGYVRPGYSSHVGQRQAVARRDRFPYKSPTSGSRTALRRSQRRANSSFSFDEFCPDQLGLTLDDRQDRRLQVRLHLLLCPPAAAGYAPLAVSQGRRLPAVVHAREFYHPLEYDRRRSRTDSRTTPLAAVCLGTRNRRHPAALHASQRKARADRPAPAISRRKRHHGPYAGGALPRCQRR